MKTRRFPTSGGTYLRWADTNCKVNRLIQRIIDFTAVDFGSGDTLHVIFYDNKDLPLADGLEPTVGEVKVTML